MTYQCPKCGGSFTVEGGVQSVQCPHCNEVVQVGVPQMPAKEVGVFDAGPSGKSRGIAALLCFFLGEFGAHYFYVGKNTAGIILLLVGLFTCYAGGLLWVLLLVQTIMLFTMKQEEFERKYIYSDSTFPF